MSIRTGIYVRVSTDDQKENGFSIDSQLRMLKEYCEKNNYDIIGVYDDGGYSGKTLMRPAMQKLLKDIKDHKLDRLVAVKTDRLSRSNLDGFWLLNYCEENDVKIELILEPYDVSTANGEMMFGMNLVFGQRERKEIGARTRRALDEMALERVHPAKAPFGYTRNPDTGHLEINPVEAISIRRLFDLCKSGKSIRNIAEVLNKEHAYLNCNNGIWKVARVEKILNNKIYIGTFEFGKYKRKPEEILTVEDYCEPIIDMETWNKTRDVIVKNKHSNYGNFVHTFSSLVKCPLCGEIIRASESYKERCGQKKIYFYLRCKNKKCSGYNYHYNCQKIEDALIRVLDELTRYLIENKYEVMINNTSYNKDIDKIDKAIIKLEEQEKKLVDLYLESNINVLAINTKNEKIKKDIDSLKKQKEQLDPENLSKEAVVDLTRQFEYKNEENDFLFNNPLAFALIMFIPLSTFAEEKAYVNFNFKVNMVNGERIKDTEVKIFASVEGDEKNLIDRTEEFNIEEIMWSVCDVEDCSTTREVEDEAVFEEEKGYVFMIRITAKNEADIDVWGTDKAMFNGTPIEELYGEYGNTGKELMIKSKIAEEKVKPQENTKTEESKPEETKEEVKTTGEEKTCMLGLSLCCSSFLGLSICIWILIAILIILLIIIFFVLKGKKKKEEQIV